MPSEVEERIEVDKKRELSTKLCWAVGSTLHVSYGKRTALREWGDRLADRLYADRFAGMDYKGKKP